jgi:hypothetical protein
VLVEGGTGDLQQLARPPDVAPAPLLRLDERVNVHRVSREESRGPLENVHILAQPAVLAAQLGKLLALRCGQSAVLAGAAVALCLLHPVPHRGLGQVKILRDLPNRPIPRAGTTISALNSGVNERRRRGFFPMLSMIGHPSGGKPLMMDVQQGTGGRREMTGGC